jgi:adenine-specific DNA-methyltransferase
MTKISSREVSREKGQFWTSEWIADVMIAYVSKGTAGEIFDPGTGEGAFYVALKKNDQKRRFYGTDIDPAVVERAKQVGIYDKNSRIVIRDFIKRPPTTKFSAIVANPPYIRHHRMDAELKFILRSIGVKNIGSAIDGRAGIHIYFLIQALSLLDKNGKLAFIMPADSSEGVCAGKLWSWVTDKYCIEAVVTFAHNASPFPKVDTNPIIYFVKNKKQQASLAWVKCEEYGSVELLKFVKSGFITTSAALEKP